MKFRHELALTPEVEEKLERATLATHHAVHQGAREIGIGLAWLGLCILLAASILADRGE